MADQQPTEAGLTGIGKFVVFLLVLGLVGAGAYLVRDTIFPKEPGPQATAPGTTAPKAAPAAAEGEATGVEAKDATGITTSKEYKYVPAEKLPPVKGVSNYKYTNNTVVFPINMWIGWLPIVAANMGLSAELGDKAAAPVEKTMGPGQKTV